MLRKHFLFYILALFIVKIDAQVNIPKLYSESGFNSTIGGQIPFWNISNRYGVVPTDNNSAYTRVILISDSNTSQPFYVNYGLDVLGNTHNSGSVYLHQAYINTKVYFFNVLAGKKEEIFGNQDSSLSCGGLIWSNNAQPMPKIGIYIKDYITVPFTLHFIELKGGISHGWFGKQPYVKDTYLHHKYFYIQLGGKLPFHIHYGLQHVAEWGGKETATGKIFPGGFDTFYRVFFAKDANGYEYLPDGTPVKNEIGNHIGSRNYGLDYQNEKFKISAYYQTVFEDGSGQNWHNAPDGLWGMQLKFKKQKLLSKIVTEFIHTSDQSGRKNWDSLAKKELGGNDNYFNHGIYKYGWTYNGLTIGTPLITSPVINPLINSNQIYNNKVVGYNLGIEGTISKVSYKLLGTYIFNYGVNILPVPDKQNFLYSTEIYFPLGNKSKSYMHINLSGNTGNYYKSSIGLLFSYTRQIF